MPRIVLAMLVMLFVGGCGVVAANNASVNRSNVNNKLQVGMTRQEVIAVMGEPGKREAYGRTEFLMYLTEHPLLNGGERVETPVAIVEGRVTGWGRNYYDTAMKADITVRQR